MQSRWKAPSFIILTLSVSISLFLCSCTTERPPAVQLSQADENILNGPLRDSIISPNSSTISTPADARNRELTLWVPPFFVWDQNDLENVGNNEASNTILDTIRIQFEQAHPGVRVEVQAKAETGDIGLLNYLRNAQKAAPSILPDLILVNTQQLWQLVDMRLVEPLPLEDLAFVNDFYPFAGDAVIYNEEVYGFPYAADVVHLAYYQADAAPVPTDWETLLQSNESYLFPTSGYDGYINELLLLQFIGTKGNLADIGTDKNNEALDAFFKFLESGREKRIIPSDVLKLPNLERTWENFTTAGFGLATTSAHLYLNQRETFNNIEFESIPTRTGTQPTVARTWAFVILTTDTEQRTLAYELIKELFDPSVQGPWSQSAYYLPTRRSALTQWSGNSIYFEFLASQLENAIALPNGQEFIKFFDWLQSVQYALLNEEMSVEGALETMPTIP